MKFTTVILMAILPMSSFANADYQSWQVNGEPYVYIAGLEKDLFQKYVVKNSRGPAWGSDTIIAELIDNKLQTDLYERSTYWSEMGYPEKKCPHFNIEDFNGAADEGYGFTWKAVKKLKGSQKSEFYLAQFKVEIYNSESKKACSFTLKDSEYYVFLNQLDANKQPILLGYLSKNPKP